MFALAAGCAWGALALENDAAQWGLGASGLVAVISGSDRLREETQRNRKRRAAEMPSGIYGSASFMSGEDAARAGLTDPSGLFLGALGGRMLFHSGKAHLLTVAPARKAALRGRDVPVRGPSSGHRCTPPSPRLPAGVPQ